MDGASSVRTRLMLGLALGALGCDASDGAGAMGGGGAAGSGGTSSSDGAGANGGAASSGGGGANGELPLGGPEPFAEGLLTCSALPPDALNAWCCEETMAVAPSTANAVIDLTEVQLDRGTCGTYVIEGGYNALPLPSDLAAYPLKIKLPAQNGADPACEQACSNGAIPVQTTFGVTFEQPDHSFFDQGLMLAISVPPPWYFVSGGCGKGCPHPCLEGYQEYGEARSCMTMPFPGAVGFATDDPAAPSVEAVLHFVPFAETPQFCCALVE